MRVVFARRIEQIRRRWWVVLLFPALALLAVALTSLPAHSGYVGKSALWLSSPGRWPEQDTMMIVGYATLFNDPSTIERLRATKNIPEDVTFEALPIAASSILTIEATADNPEVAQSAATSVAEAFRDDLNAAGKASTLNAIADRERQFNDLLQRFPDADATSVAQMENSMQDDINTLRFDTTNLLQDLQLHAGVTKIEPPVKRNLVLGAAGGLLLGILAALGMAEVSTRIRTSADLLEKTGVEPLVEVPPSRSARKGRLREDPIRTLGNIITSQESPKPWVIAMTDCRGVCGAGSIAESLAKLLAQQEYRTVLVYANNEASQSAGYAGFTDVARDSNLVYREPEDGEVASLKILPWSGLFASRNSYATRERIVAVLDKLRSRADIIVIAAPSIVDSTEAQLLCAAADFTVLVVDSQSSRAGDVTSAVEVLRRARADVLGAVLIHGTKGQSAGPTISTQQQSLRASQTPQHGRRRPDTPVGTPHR
jgi:polysaccharide biosynthesis transport protein